MSNVNVQTNGATKQGTGRLYLYAVAEAGSLSLAGLQGMSKAALHTIEHGGLAVVVSDLPDKKVRPRRRNLEIHHTLLKDLADQADVLPMAFGIIAQDADEVRAFLMNNSETLREQLDRVRGHVEVVLRATWNVEDIFTYFVEQHADLRVMRDEFLGENGTASRDQMIRLGQLFEQRLEEVRQEHLDAITTHLDTVCTDFRADDCRDEKEIMNVACLVPKGGFPFFEDAVREAASRYSDEYLFRYTEPMAPYSFAEIAFEQ